MKIFFAAAFTYSRKNLPNYQKIVKTLEKMGHEVLSKHVADPKTKLGDGLSPEKLYARETNNAESADAMVAEITTPSWGTPFLMAHALEHNKPVLALFYGDNPQEIPLMIKGHPDLYVENYDEDNIERILKQYLEHFENQKERKGKLIVIDGGDGSGKATQTKLLIDYLKNKKIPVKTFDFPRYYTSFHGRMVGRYLTGEFGDVNNVSPYLISLAYAVDRAGAREEMNDWLVKGGIIITNRYTTTSMAYMSAKIPEGAKRDEFIDWLDELEYRIHRLPREDLVIYLDVPPKIGQELVDKKDNRGYTKGVKRDIHERNLAYLGEVEKVYLDLIRKKKNWIKIGCYQDHQLRSKEEIHQEILKVLKEKKII
ncbi:MAG: hypothetical protein V1858_05440 [Candidatus Gottesmanbacteria bacterium]